MFCKKSIYILLVIFLFSLFSVSALDFDADLVATKNKITIDQVAEFTLTIYNYETTRESFRIKNTDYLLWDIYTKPRLSPITIDVPPKSNASVNLLSGLFLVMWQVVEVIL